MCYLPKMLALYYKYPWFSNHIINTKKWVEYCNSSKIIPDLTYGINFSIFIELETISPISSVKSFGFLTYVNVDYDLG